MALDLTCFDGVVGLANCACPCLTDTAPEGYNDSASGLYIADLVPLEMLEGADNCNDPQNPWNVLADGRTQGINQLFKDISAGLLKKNQLTRQPYKGMIGEKTARTTKSLSKTYAGVRLCAKRVKGGYMRITRIGGVFSTNGTVSVQIYDRFNAAHGSPVVITTAAGVHASATCNINLPLWVDGAPNAEYFAVYTVNQANLPKNNELWCKCTKVPIPEFSTIRPYYENRYTGANAWANWMMAGEWEGNNLTDFDLAADDTFTGSGMNGLTITCELTCDPVTSVCLEELDFTDPVALSLAHALRYISAINVAQKIIRTAEPYRNAAVSREVLAVDIQDWWKDYETNLNYVVYHANTNNSDCIFCKPAFSMSLQTKLP